MIDREFRLLCIISLILSMTGCMKTATKLWNNTGYKLPDKERQIYHECYDEADKFYNEKKQRELWNKVWINCVENKENQ